MKLEDCTKEELIHVMRRTMFFKEDRIEFDVLMLRSENTRKKADEEFDKYQKDASEYLELLKPYVGKPLKDLPDSVLNKALTAEQNRSRHYKNYEKYNKEEAEIQKQINRNLNLS